MLKMVGASGQLSLGKKYSGKYFKVTRQPDGAVLLSPMKVVPEDEAWLHEPAMRKRLKAADEWMAANPPAESKLGSLKGGSKSRR